MIVLQVIGIILLCILVAIGAWFVGVSSGMGRMLDMDVTEFIHYKNEYKEMLKKYGIEDEDDDK